MSKPPKTSDFVKNVFSEIPATYERINHILTLGLDTVWRRRTARIASATSSARWADMCTGTGEMAVCLYGLMPKGTSIKAVDFSPDMLAEARKKPEAKFIEFVTADTSALPFPGEHFDLITMSFATRNINLNRETLVRSFAEFYRVVKPGGRFVNLETSQPSNSIIRNCFHLYVKLIVKRVGYKMSGSRRGYAYLAATIPRFYSTEELADIMREAGFEKVTFKRLLFGVAAIHHATKLGD